jgi:hypothetical protein
VGSFWKTNPPEATSGGVRLPRQRHRGICHGSKTSGVSSDSAPSDSVWKTNPPEATREALLSGAKPDFGFVCGKLGSAPPVLRSASGGGRSGPGWQAKRPGVAFAFPSWFSSHIAGTLMFNAVARIARQGGRSAGATVPLGTHREKEGHEDFTYPDCNNRSGFGW